MDSNQVVNIHTYFSKDSKARRTGGYYQLPSKAEIETEFAPIPIPQCQLNTWGETHYERITNHSSPGYGEHGFCMSSDGRYVFNLRAGQGSSPEGMEVNRWELATPFDLSSINPSVNYIVEVSDYWAGQSTYWFYKSGDICWDTSGTRFYSVQQKAFENPQIWQYNCSSPWDLATVTSIYRTNLSEAVDISDQFHGRQWLTMSDDGINFHTGGTENNNAVTTWYKMTGWDSRTLVKQNHVNLTSKFGTSVVSNTAGRLFITANGEGAVINNNWGVETTNQSRFFTLSTPWDFNSATYLYNRALGYQAWGYHMNDPMDKIWMSCTNTSFNLREFGNISCPDYVAP